MENFCLFESNKSIYLINNTKLYPTKKYPSTLSWPLFTFRNVLFVVLQALSLFPKQLADFLSSRHASPRQRLSLHDARLGRLEQHLPPHRMGEQPASLRPQSRFAASRKTLPPIFAILDGNGGVLPRSDQSESNLRRPEGPFPMGPGVLQAGQDGLSRLVDAAFPRGLRLFRVERVVLRSSRRSPLFICGSRSSHASFRPCTTRL